MRNVTLEDLEKNKDKMDAVTYNRGLHGVSEDKRTLEAAEVLVKGDFKRFGELMNASHDSLRDLFEVSCPEVDELVEIARKTKGVYGSRITGGGFGGCTVTLIEKDAIQSLKDAVNVNYLHASLNKQYLGKLFEDSYILRRTRFRWSEDSLILQFYLLIIILCLMIPLNDIQIISSSCNF